MCNVLGRESLLMMRTQPLQTEGEVAGDVFVARIAEMRNCQRTDWHTQSYEGQGQTENGEITLSLPSVTFESCFPISNNFLQMYGNNFLMFYFGSRNNNLKIQLKEGYSLLPKAIINY